MEAGKPSQGKGENSLAEQLSRDLGAIVIAPTENIVVEGDNPQVYDEGFLFNTGGSWVTFYDGKVVDQMNGYDSFFKTAIDIENFIKNLNVDDYINKMKKKYDEQKQ